MAIYHRRQLVALRQALEEARFGAERTLNLRASLPTAADAAARAEAWLRQQQVERAGEVLIITGRGNQSPGGVSAVRAAVLKLFGTLKRRGVVAEHREQTPGSFVVRLAPMSALLGAPRRRRDARPPAAAPDPPALRALDEGTRALLRRLALRALETLGVRDTGQFVEAEMLRQFGIIAAAIPAGADREKRLHRAIERAIEEIDHGP
jgi:hypothetical protein